MNYRMSRALGRDSRKEIGAAAVEFALVFPILLFLIYGVVVYGYLFIIHSSMSYAAQESAEIAVAVDPLVDPVDYNTAVTQLSRQAAMTVLNWLPATQFNAIVGDATGSNITVTPPATPGEEFVRVQLSFAINDSNFLPSLNIGGLEIPPLPDQLSVESSAAL